MPAPQQVGKVLETLMATRRKTTNTVPEAGSRSGLKSPQVWHKLPVLPKTLGATLCKINCGEHNDGKDRKDSRPQESDGHLQKHRLPQVRQTHPHREARERPRARRPGRGFYLVLGLRVLRKAVKTNLNLDSRLEQNRSSEVAAWADRPHRRRASPTRNSAPHWAFGRILAGPRSWP